MEKTYNSWFAHLLMLKFGFQKVVVESHHDGKALSNALYPYLKKQYQQKLKKKGYLPVPKGYKGSFNFDIAIARSDNVDIQSYQKRFPQYKNESVSIEDRRSNAVTHLLQFSLIIEIKVTDDLKVTDKIAKDLLKLGTTIASIKEYSKEHPIPEMAFIVIYKGSDNLPSAEVVKHFFEELKKRAKDFLIEPKRLTFPHFFLVGRSGIVRCR